MLGRFDLQMFESPGLTPELVAAWKKQGLDPIRELQRYEKVGRWATDNLVIGTTPSFYFYHCWAGAAPYYPLGQNAALLFALGLTTLATEPGYQTEYLYSAINGNPANIPNLVSSTGGKTIITDDIVSAVIDVDPDGREAVFGTFRFLYYPGEATSGLIKSVEIWHHGSGTIYGARVARVRIKDSGGNPVTLVKTAARSLMIQYTYTMPSV
jgi:hypothetical protein